VGNDEWWSLADLNIEAPDHHHDTTVDNLGSIFNASENLRCFHKEHVLVAEIQKSQLHDDPVDVEGDTKIEDIRRTFRSGTPLPAVVVVHMPEGRSPFPSQKERGIGFYLLLEGRHRYNAIHREEAPQIYAWVAHVGCCGGPEADLGDS
jgi:hypothetical protein